MSKSWRSVPAAWLNIIRQRLSSEQNRIRKLEPGLQSVLVWPVNSVRLNVNVRETHATLLDVLSEQSGEYRDLFNSNRLTFPKRWRNRTCAARNPQIDMGKRTPQTIGELTTVTI